MACRLRLALTAMKAVPDLDHAADFLKMSPRSLRRHLADEDTSFQIELDHFRADLAKDYLGDGVICAKEVARLLGFSHVDAFRRAFKTWTGQTIRDFQMSRIGAMNSQSSEQYPGIAEPVELTH